jgi:hypothetical protein
MKEYTIDKTTMEGTSFLERTIFVIRVFIKQHTAGTIWT